MHLTQRIILSAAGGDSRCEDSVSTLARPRRFDNAATADLAPTAAISEIPTRQELAEVDEVVLKRVTEIWRAHALRGDTRALSIASALETELRRRLAPIQSV